MTHRPYSVVAAQALVLCIGGYVLNFLAPAAPIALAVNVLCLWRLFSVAQTYARDAVEGFDATVAAEAIVGFGVMALVLGLATLVFLFISGQLILTAAEAGTVDFRGQPHLRRDWSRPVSRLSSRSSCVCVSRSLRVLWTPPMIWRA